MTQRRYPLVKRINLLEAIHRDTDHSYWMLVGMAACGPRWLILCVGAMFAVRVFVLTRLERARAALTDFDEKRQHDRDIAGCL